VRSVKKLARLEALPIAIHQPQQQRIDERVARIAPSSIVRPAISRVSGSQNPSLAQAKRLLLKAGTVPEQATFPLDKYH
jgi:hypothetical protein